MKLSSWQRDFLKILGLKLLIVLSLVVFLKSMKREHPQERVSPIWRKDVL